MYGITVSTGMSFSALVPKKEGAKTGGSAAQSIAGAFDLAADIVSYFRSRRVT